jgi:hypothetical protein
MHYKAEWNRTEWSRPTAVTVVERLNRRRAAVRSTITRRSMMVVVAASVLQHDHIDDLRFVLIKDTSKHKFGAVARD